jgi:hypothetical protein
MKKNNILFFFSLNLKTFKYHYNYLKILVFTKNYTLKYSSGIIDAGNSINSK